MAVAIGSAIGLLFMELGSAALFAVDIGGLVWTRVPAEPPRTIDLAENDKRIRLHPYYGYTGRAGMRLADVAAPIHMAAQFGERFMAEDYATIGFNSHGFMNRVAFPYAKHDTEFVVGVFGGSVAIQFAATAHHALAPSLERAGLLKGRRLVLLNFANGGAKQPQQATALAYFLSIGQRFDYVVNLDGFNEAFIGWYNFVEHRAPVDMPFARFILGIQNIDLAEAGAPRGGAAHTRAARAARTWTVREHATRSGLVWLVSRIVAKRSKDELTIIEKAATTQPANVDYSMPIPSAPKGTFDDVGLLRIVEMWRDASIAMKGMCDRFGIPYLHVLQPNQYVARLDYGELPEERVRVAGLTQPPVATFIPLTYDGYRRQRDGLREAGVAFLDASPLFDGKPSRLFHDNCCHMTYDGNALLAEAVGSRMAEASSASK